MTTYSINLEDVDLALLPLRTYKYNDFLKKEHFEFQVLKTDIVEEPKPTVLYTCHICAIEVPAAFAREHATSIKHRANARIASVAVERTRALIAALPPPAATQPFARFCGNCATIVDEEHEKTKEHRVAVMHDRLLWDLMKEYVQEGYDEFEYDDFDDQRNGINNSYKINKYENDRDYIDVNDDDNDKDRRVTQIIHNNSLMTLINNKSELKRIHEGEQAAKYCELNGDHEKHKEDLQYKVETCHCDDLNNNSTENIGSVNQAVLTIPSVVAKTPEAKDVAQNGPNSTGPRINPLINGMEHHENSMENDYEDYGEKLRKLIVNKDSFEFTENASLIHIKINDVTVNIYSDNFHSYDRLYYSGKLECIVCDCILDTDDAEDHKNDSKHMRRIINLGNDYHHVREINDSYSHCILCNLKIENTSVDMHKQLPLHIVRKDIYTSKPNKTQDVTAKKDSVKQRGNTKNDKNTTNGSIPAIKLKNKGKSLVTKKTSNIVGSVNEYPYEELANGHVWCVVCKCKVPDGARNRKQHIKGLKHQQAQTKARAVADTNAPF